MPSHYGSSKPKPKTKKKTMKKKPMKKVPAGFHRMPDGSVMKNGKHKSKK